VYRGWSAVAISWEAHIHKNGQDTDVSGLEFSFLLRANREPLSVVTPSTSSTKQAVAGYRLP